MGFPSYNIYQKYCGLCGDLFTAQRSDTVYCSPKCANRASNIKAKRLSLRLKPEQLEVILALQDYFIRDWKFDRERNG